MADDLVVSGIHLDARDTMREIDRLDRRMRRLEGQVDEVTSSTRRAERQFHGFGRTVAGAAAAFGAFRAAERASRFIFRTNVQFQQLEARLVSVTGSVEDAEAAFQMIKDFAKTTPFQIQGLIEAFTQLNLRGIEPTVGMMEDLGNFAAAFGRDMTDLVNAITRAAQGGTERLREGFGIPIQKMGDQLRVEFRGTARTVEAEAGALIDLFRELARENFGDAMARQMDTLVGSLSNLEDVAEIAATKVGEEGLNRALQDLVGTLEDAIEDNEAFARSLGQSMASGVRTADAALQLLVEHTEAIIQAMQVLTGLAVGRTFAGMATRMAAAASAGRGLASVMAVLGGPAGIGFGAAGALAALADEAHGAEADTDELRQRIDELVGSLDDLTEAEIRNRMEDIRSQLRDTVAEMSELRPDALSPDMGAGEATRGVLDRIRRMTEAAGATIPGPAGGMLTMLTGGASETIGQMTELENKADVLRETLAELRNALLEMGEAAGGDDGAAGGSERAAEEIEKLIQSLEEERDELKFSREELVARRLSEMGASEATIAQAQAIVQKIQALEDEKDAQEEARKAEERRIEDALDHMEDVRQANREIREQAQQRAADFASQLQLAEIQEEVRRAEEAARGISDALTDPLVDLVTQTETVVEAFESMVTGILNQVARLLVEDLVGDLLSSFLRGVLVDIPDAPSPIPAPDAPDLGDTTSGGVVPGLAGGGRLKAGEMAVVGERGPELFIPDRSGTVTPDAAGQTVNSKVEMTIVANDTRGFDRLLEARQGLLTRLVRQGIAEGMG